MRWSMSSKSWNDLSPTEISDTCQSATLSLSLMQIFAYNYFCCFLTFSRQTLTFCLVTPPSKYLTFLRLIIKLLSKNCSIKFTFMLPTSPHLRNDATLPYKTLRLNWFRLVRRIRKVNDKWMIVGTLLFAFSTHLTFDGLVKKNSYWQARQESE